MEQAVLAELEAALGPGGVIAGDAAKELAASSWAPLGEPLAILRPTSTAEVSAALKIAHAAGLPVVAWGGKTGLVWATRADGALALSLERMNRIEAIDPIAATMTVEAGCILQVACEAADAAGLFLPLDLGARGTATIGGNISTNAGGNRVIRYGMMRDMVLGLEAVLADGTVVSSLNALMKNNTGYDLKQLFIGSEGTLGVVTRAVIRLRPQPRSQETAFAAVPSFEAVTGLLRHVSAGLGGMMSAFEVMWPSFYELVTTPPALGRPPLPPGHAFYVLIESMGGDAEEDPARFEKVLGEALEAGLAEDIVIAKSRAERDKMWGLRDDVGQTSRNGPIQAFDVSLKAPDMPAYLEAVRQGLEARWPDASLTVFGHLGDGNLHLITGVGPLDLEIRHAVDEVVYGPLQAIGGSISAEHGIGLQKRPFLSISRSPAEIALMRTLKNALDPKGILNPGKVLEPV